MGFEEHFEGKGISSFTISQNGNVNIQKKYSKKKISISILTVIAISLAAIFIYYSYIRPEYTICQTKSCLRSAVTLINCMNETVEPCEDFYEFACGMFETNYPYYSNTNENSWMTIMTLKIKHRVKKFLNKENEKYEPTAVHKTRKFYQVCLNSTEDQNSIKYDPLWNVWKKIGLNTDYLNDSVPLEIETILARVGVHFSLDIFFQIDIEADPRNSSSHLLLNIDQNLELNKYKERKNLKTNNVNIEEDLLKFSEYFNLLVDKLLNRNQSYIKKFTVQSLLNTTNKLVQFREEFSQVSQDSFNLKNDIPEVITLRELQEFTDITGDKLKFNWTLYLRELTRDVQPKVYEILTSEKANNYELLISNRDHLNKVFILLSQTPTIIIKMYILFHVVAALENNLPSGETFNAEYCLSLTSEFFGMVTGYSMINTLDNSSKASLTEMTDNIKWALRKMVHEASWMDDETKNATLRKLANTKTYFGYPNNYDKILNNFYENLNVTDNHIENIISISKFRTKSSWKYLTVDRDSENQMWDITPDVVNAYCYNSMNAFFMPAAILQTPLYHNGIQALNYGATGSTIGHELSHNYDNTGRLYNELGNVAQWWTNKSYEEYTKKASCLISNYDGITVVNHNSTFVVNGTLTLDENIADIVGLKEAYYAYRHYVDIHGQEPRLPGLERFSQEQLFFLGYANQYCHYDEYGSQFDIYDRHCPDVVRVREVLSLSPEFAKAWSCPIGAPMNPKKDKCQIW
ncbi:neprilysin-11-like isoform X18 [Aphis gossypii]|uniref:neprilysin-11-like isoform X18 n=1 Tax=Aphis gossypii TaxID=80765 RepID=UPI0021591448|nr:neprilysin-11-like isoform X18 [Aphis gossypii]